VFPSHDHGGGTATDTAIDGLWRSKWFNFGDLVNEKSTTQVVFYHEIPSGNTTLTFGYSYDLEDADQFSQLINIGTSGDVYGTGTYGEATYAASGGGLQRRTLDGRGRVIRLSYSNDILDEEFQINGFGFFLSLETVA